MRAIFKPEDPSKLIINDIDDNERAYISNFVDKLNKGARIEAVRSADGFDNTAGMVLTVGVAPDIIPEWKPMTKYKKDDVVGYNYVDPIISRNSKAGFWSALEDFTSSELFNPIDWQYQGVQLKRNSMTGAFADLV